VEGVAVLDGELHCTMADNSGGFLGGGPQFNKAGASAPHHEVKEDQFGPAPGAAAYKVRVAIAVVAIAVLVASLFYMDVHPGYGKKSTGRSSGAASGSQDAPPQQW
jgi:hypothetical protein